MIQDTSSNQKLRHRFKRHRSHDSLKTAFENNDNENLTFSNLRLYEKTHHLQKSFDTQIRMLKDDVGRQISELHDEFSRNNCRNGEESESSDLRKIPKKSLEMMRKKFIPRKSLLSDLFEVRDINTIRHVFIAVLILFAIEQMFRDIYERDSLLTNLDLIVWCFHKISAVIVIWFQMKFLTLALYVIYFNWIRFRLDSVPKHLVKYYDKISLFCYICYLSLFCVLPLMFLIREKPGLCSSIIMLMEQTRLLMKQHAFIRETISPALKGEECPDFSNYLYFLFAPTLIYRNEYPRNSAIRWHYVFNCFSEFIATVIYSYYVFLKIKPPDFFETKNSTTIENLKNLAKSVYSCILPGSLLLLLVFYGFFHCWLNAFAEMMRFADRMFYKDWWNCTTYRHYFRKWNMVVHDWLFNYIYLDCLKLFGVDRRLLCSFIVVSLSSLFHEYIFTFMFGYFYPVNLVLFGIIGFVVSIVYIPEDSTIGNVFFLLSFIIGLGINVSLCSLGWHARKYCNVEIGRFWDLLLPKFLICIGYNSTDY